MPTYFGPGSRLFGMLDWPHGGVRAGVVYCLPVGYEAVAGYDACRELAERLTDRGLAGLRLDYPGTGNSFGDGTHASGLSDWVAAVGEAAAQLRRAGVEQVFAVGLRLGATVAGLAASAADAFDGVVLVEPVLSGRQYVRALRMLAASSESGAADDDRVWAGGVRFGRPLLDELAAIRLDPSTLAVPTLTASGLADLLDMNAELARLPEHLLDQVATWLDERAPARAVALPSPVGSNTVAETVQDGVRHRALRLDGRAFAIESSPVGGQADTGVLLLNNGVARNIGPGGAWAEQVPALARRGSVVLRLDVSAVGETPATRIGPDRSYPAEARHDVQVAADALRAAGAQRLVAAGLCSGALHVLRGAAAGAGLTTVVAINAPFESSWVHYRTDLGRRHLPWPQRLAGYPLDKTPLKPALTHLPVWVWSLLDRLHLVRSPLRLIRQACDRGVRVVLLCGRDDWGLTALRTRYPRGLAVLQAEGRLEVIELGGLDHSMFAPGAREAVFAVLDRVIGAAAGDRFVLSDAPGC